jgi:hypothetical protein
VPPAALRFFTVRAPVSGGFRPESELRYRIRRFNLGGDAAFRKFRTNDPVQHAGRNIPAAAVVRHLHQVGTQNIQAKHPRKMVLNAFLRRGAPVRSTQCSRYRYHYGMPTRSSETTAEVFDFFDKVEAYE